MLRRITGTVGALALAALAATACASNGDSGGSAGSDTTGPVKIMALGAFTVADPLGYSSKVAQAAAADVNAAGGIKGRTIDLVVCDTHGNPNDDLACGRQAVADQVSAVITMSPDVAIDTEVIKKAGIPVVAVLGFQPSELTDDNVFNISGGSPSLGFAPAAALVKGAHAKKVTVVYANQPDGIVSRDMATSALTRLGVPAQRTTPVNAHSTADYTPQVVAATQNGIDSVALILPFDAIDRFIKAAQAASVKGIAWGTTDESMPPSVISDLGQAAEGMWIANYYKPLTLTDDPGVKDFLAKVQKYDPGVDPNNWVLPWVAEGWWVAVHLVAHVGNAISQPATPASLLAGLGKVKGYDTGLTAPLDLTAPVSGLPGATRIFNTKVFFGRVQGGKVVPDGGAITWVDPLKAG